MKAKEIERILGIAVGPTVLGLVRAAKAVNRLDPEGATAALGFSLPWLVTKRQRDILDAHPFSAEVNPSLRRSSRGEYLGTPTAVRPFALSVGDRHYGFLTSAGTSTEDCPIVMVVPGEPDHATQVIAPNLRDFLGLVAACRTATLSRDASDLELLHRSADARLNKYAEAEIDKVLRAFHEYIPDLEIPCSPSAAIRAAESPRFELSIPLSHPLRQEIVPSPLDQANSAMTRGRHAFEAGAFGRAAQLLEPALSHHSTRPRALALRVRSLIRVQDRDGARATFRELVHDWLDDAPTSDGPHARSVVPTKELLELLDSLKLPAANDLADQIHAAGDPPVADGDFL